MARFLALLFIGLALVPSPVHAQSPTGNEEAVCSRADVFRCDNFEDRTLTSPCDMTEVKP